ncbi:serine/threonine-protein kinase [uncultured Pseudokineococcus sp.]|uniref:serine/threonine-protein kinase n=1 Tax=uncultured Pseudokineococcus sp. TaxID=1642928 RepID=UPI0026032943|nr:serine/threonine-protein kinase [uncultured Pseudokineococcus sp.]
MEQRGPGARPGAGGPPVGRRLGPYRLVHQVGEGGMGVVHLALDPADRAVALKVLRPHVAGDPSARERLRREVAVLRRVRHRLVAEVLDADPDGPQPYVVTQFVPGRSLEQHVQEEGPLAPAALARLADGLGQALAAVHDAGVVHRDLKPANVLMLDGDPVVIDFGIAKVADDVRLTSVDLVMGTPGYLAPELADGAEAGPAADWWGWAATTAFAATGRPPFGRGPWPVVLDRVRRGAADLDGVPEPLVPALAAALSPRVEERPREGWLRRAVEELAEAARRGDPGGAGPSAGDAAATSALVGLAGGAPLAAADPGAGAASGADPDDDPDEAAPAGGARGVDPRSAATTAVPAPPPVGEEEGPWDEDDEELVAQDDVSTTALPAAGPGSAGTPRGSGEADDRTAAMSARATSALPRSSTAEPAPVGRPDPWGPGPVGAGRTGAAPYRSAPDEPARYEAARTREAWGEAPWTGADRPPAVRAPADDPWASPAAWPPDRGPGAGHGRAHDHGYERSYDWGHDRSYDRGHDRGYDGAGAPASLPPLGEPPVRLPDRPGLRAAWAAALVAVTALLPAVGVLVAAVVVVVARVVERSQRWVSRRRELVGPRRGDVPLAVLRSPLPLLGALVPAAAQLVLPLAVAAAVVFLAGVLLEGAAVVPGDPVTLAAGATAGVVTAWWGPGGGRLRRGAGLVSRAAPTGAGGAVLVVLGLLVVVAGAWLAVGGAAPDWGPLPSPPPGF